MVQLHRAFADIKLDTQSHLFYLSPHIKAISHQLFSYIRKTYLCQAHLLSLYA